MKLWKSWKVISLPGNSDPEGTHWDHRQATPSNTRIYTDFPVRNQGSAIIVNDWVQTSWPLILASSPCCHRHSWWWWSTGGWGRRSPRRLTRWRPRRGWWIRARGAGTVAGRWSCTWGHQSLLINVWTGMDAVYYYCNNVEVRGKWFAWEEKKKPLDKLLKSWWMHEIILLSTFYLLHIPFDVDR